MEHLLRAKRRPTNRRFVCLLLALGAIPAAFALCSQAALAQDGSGTLTDVANAFKVTSGAWIETALGYARHLFFALVAIELAWTAITYVLQRDSLSDFVAQLVLKLMGVFFFLALLQNAPTWIPAIVDSFSQAGAAISGQPVALDPSSTFGQGLQLAKGMLGTLNSPELFTAILPVLLAVFCAIGVVVAFAVVAGQLMVTLIESYIVISAGLFFLGFSGSRWTLPFSERYVGYAVSVGIKLFMLYLIVGLGTTLAGQWQTLFAPGVLPAPEVYVGVAGSALVFMLLGWQIPNLAGALMNGSPAMTLGAAGNMLGTTVSAGAGVASGVLGAAGLGGAAAMAAASAIAARSANPASLEQSNQKGASRPIGFIEPTPRGQEPNSRTVADGPTPTPSAGGAENVQPNLANDGDALTSPAVSAPDVGQAYQSAPGADAQPMQSLDDVAAQLKAKSPSPGSSAYKAFGSAFDMVRSIRIPALPHDAGSGSIQIRFRHHDGD